MNGTYSCLMCRQALLSLCLQRSNFKIHYCRVNFQLGMCHVLMVLSLSFGTYLIYLLVKEQQLKILLNSDLPNIYYLLYIMHPFFKKNIYLFIFGCVGSSFLCAGFLQLRQVGATLHRGARASHYRGLSCCRAQAPDAQAQQLWLTGPVALQHVGSSQTRARTRVPCIGRQILNHWATKEALNASF